MVIKLVPNDIKQISPSVEWCESWSQKSLAEYGGTHLYVAPLLFGEAETGGLPEVMWVICYILHPLPKVP